MEVERIVCVMFFSLVGFAFFTYGKKQQAVVPLCVGLGLFAVPYFITNLPILISVGVGLIVLPYFVKV